MPLIRFLSTCFSLVSLESFFQSISSQFQVSLSHFKSLVFSHAFQFEFLIVLAHMVRHFVYGVLETSKEMSSPIRPMLVPVFAACHQGLKWVLTMSRFQRCFTHELQYKSYPKYVHQNHLTNIFPTVYCTLEIGSWIRRYDRNE